MALLKPPLIVVVMVEVFWLPCGMVRDEGEVEIVKLPGLVTVRVTVVISCIPPPVPVTVMAYMPGGVLLPTVMVMVELPEPGGERVCGLKVIAVPEGAPEEESTMELLKPPMRVEVMVEVPGCPARSRPKKATPKA